MLTADEALEVGEKWVGKGYTNIGQSERGIF